LVSEQQPESKNEFVVFGKGSAFSDRPLSLEEDGTDGSVIIEDVNTDIPEQKNIGLIAIFSDLGVETQSCAYVYGIKVVVQDGVSQHEGFPWLVFHG
jgi:hypothetical protein